MATIPLRACDYGAALIGVGIMSAVAYAIIAPLWYSSVRLVRALAMAGVLLLVAFPLDFMRRSAGWTFGINSGVGRLSMVIGISITVILLAATYRQRFFAILLWVLALVSPYAGINATIAIARALNSPAAQETPSDAKAARRKEPAKRRLIWIIFDEWDQAALTDSRRPGLSLKNVDDLLRHSVVATDAIPPSGRTMVSLPALLSGRRIDEAVASGSADLELKLSDHGAWRSFRTEDNVVTHALETGKRVGVVGWYHPYERLLPPHPNLITLGVGFPMHSGYRRESLLGSVVAQLRYLVPPLFGRAEVISLYESLHKAALTYSADPSLDFLFIHYNVPHLPGIFSLRTESFSEKIQSSTDGYWGNLVLVDRAVGEIFDAVRSAGLDKNTSFIFTSDHWWRTAPWLHSKPSFRVPLMIRASGDEQGLQVSKPLCTVDIRQIAEGLLDGSLHSNAAIAERLEKMESPVPLQFKQGLPIW